MWVAVPPRGEYLRIWLRGLSFAPAISIHPSGVWSDCPCVLYVCVSPSTSHLYVDAGRYFGPCTLSTLSPVLVLVRCEALNI